MPALARQRQLLPDVERRKPVERVLSTIGPKLFLRPLLQAVEVLVKEPRGSSPTSRSRIETVLSPSFQ